MFSVSRPQTHASHANPSTAGFFARFGAWCRTLFVQVPYRETAAVDLHVTGKVALTVDRSALIINVTGGIEYQLDADCQCIATRPAVRNTYTLRFAPHQTEAVTNIPLIRDTLSHMEKGPVNARLYICDGRVDQVTLVSHNGSELEWSNWETSP